VEVRWYFKAGGEVTAYGTGAKQNSSSGGFPMEPGPADGVRRKKIPRFQAGRLVGELSGEENRGKKTTEKRKCGAGENSKS